MTGAALWLVARELGARRRRVALAGLVVAAMAAAATAVEWLARAREEAIAAQIDAMGPAVTVVPRGVGAGALARLELGDGVLPPGVEGGVRAALGRELRGVERRLVLTIEVAGVRVPVIGVEAELPPAGSGAAALGSELAHRVGAAPNVISLSGRTFPVVGVRASTGSREDMAVFLPLPELQALAGVEGVNELRLRLRAGGSPAEVAERLAGAGLGAAVIRSDRGSVADVETQQSLARHRELAYAVMAAVAALCLVAAAHLDATERRVELATLVAIGASRWTVLGALLSRSAAVAAAGAALGVALGAVIAAVQDAAVADVVAGGWAVAGTTVAAALGLGAVAAVPTAIAAVVRDPVRELQEG